MSFHPEPRAKLIANLAWIPALAVGALQMFKVDAGVLTRQGADFFGPIALYASFRTNGTILKRLLRGPLSSRMSVVAVLAGCFAWELCQLFDFRGTPLAITRGSFDPLDLAAYGAGVGAAFVAERLLGARFTQTSHAAAGQVHQNTLP